LFSKIRITLPALCFYTCLLFYRSPLLLGTLAAALVHELGHLWAALACRIRIQAFTLDLLGARLRVNDSLLSYRQEILLCLGGPLVNLLCFAEGTFLSHMGISLSPFFEGMTLGSLCLAVVNLLPIATFDGGRILYALLCAKGSEGLAHRLLRISSLLCLGVLWLSSVYLLLRYSASLPLFIFCVGMFFRLFVVST